MKLFLSLFAVFTLFMFGAGQVDATDEQSAYPIYGCHKLTGEWIDTATVKVESEFIATNGVTLVEREYNFGDGTVVTTNANGSAPALHTYLHLGNYIVSVTFRFNVNGHDVTVQDNACRVVADNYHLAYKVSSYTCTALAASELDHATYRFDLAPINKQKGTSLFSTTYTFTFDNGYTIVNSSGSATHRYVEPGEYFVTAEAVTSVSGIVVDVRSGNCTVIVEAQPTNPTADHRP